MKREVFLFGRIESSSVNKLVKELLYLDSLSQEEITMYISSGGGSVISGLLLIDTIKMIRSKVKMVVLDQAASMAAIILAAGEQCLAFPHSCIMLHQISGDIKAYEVMKMLEEKTLRLLSEKTGKSIEIMRQLSSFENFLTAQEAKELGIVDEIVA